MGKGTDLKRRVVTAHAKDLETRLADVLRLVQYPPPLLEPVEKELASALAHVRNIVKLLEPLPEPGTKGK